MNTMQELEQAFQQTFDDKILSKSERRALGARIQEAGLDQREIGVLRAKVFDIAREGLKKDKYFTMEWLEDASRLLDVRDNGEEKKRSSAYFSPGMDCLDAIISQIQASRDSLDICVFTISDDRITNAILDRHRMGTPVRIITDNDKLHDSGSDISALAASNVPVRIDTTPYHMHHKFAIVDGKSLITGSYNWTRSAEKYNEENVLIMYEPHVIDRYKQEFRDLWKKSEPF